MTNYLKKIPSIKYSAADALCILVIFFILTVTFLFIMDSWPVKQKIWTYVQTLALLVLMLYPLRSENKVLSILGGVMTLYAFINIFPRVLSFFVGILNVNFPFVDTLDYGRINTALTFILCAMAAFKVGVISLERVAPNFGIASSESFTPGIEPIDCLIALLCFLMGHYWLISHAGYSIFNTDAHVRSNVYYQIFSTLLPVNMGLSITLAVLVLRRLSGGKILVPLIFLGSVYFVEQMLVGSRSGPLNFFLYLVGGYIVLANKSKEKLATIFLALGIFGLASLASFQFGSSTRSDLMSQRYISPPEVIQLNPLLTRLYAPVDTAFLSMALEPNPEYIKKYMDGEYVIKSAINTLLPGVPFDGFTLNISQAWPVIYNIRSYDYVSAKSYYESFIWTSFGFFFVMFGWAGVAVFLFSGAFSAFIWKLSDYLPNPVGVPLKIWFVDCLISYIFMMSLDDWLVTLTFKLIHVLIFVMACGLVKILRQSVITGVRGSKF